jgi:signal transduction histidine kinase
VSSTERGRPSGTGLLAKLAKTPAEARNLQRISSEINSTLDLDEIYQIVLRTMDDLFGFTHSLIFILAESGEKLTVVASRGYPEPTTGAQVAMGVGLVGVVAKKRRMMRLNHLGQQRAYMSTIRSQMEQAGRSAELGEIAKLPGLPNVECQIAIPLQVKDTLIGVFAVESEKESVFSERDETLIAIVANQAATAIHNARLYRAEAEGRRELALAHERLRQLNETLEERVRARTAELVVANRELKEAQSQLVQSAKMATLGDLVAGIAHEINTPLGAIHANADVAQRTARLLAAILKDEDFAPLFARHPKLAVALRSLDEAASTNLSASDRIVGIVKSLRQFARLDEAERKKVDLHDGIESTLTLLRHKLREGVVVKKDYGDLPAIECFPSRLNQVFMNLLVNAIQAMEGEGTVTITSRQEGDVAVLQFADTGCGIASERLERIFDPGFTTKGVGVGTGLGLSISYRIIQDHGGSIEVASRPGEGSVFTLRLPIRG